MFIILQKKQNSNQWHYPSDAVKFVKAFSNPSNIEQLIVENNSGKSLAELTTLAGYPVLEYTGENQYTEVKLVDMGALGELLPDEVLVELVDYSNDKTAVQAIRNGATRILTRVNSNQPVDVLDPAFINLLQSLVSFTSLTNTQATNIFNTLKG